MVNFSIGILKVIIILERFNKKDKILNPKYPFALNDESNRKYEI